MANWNDRRGHRGHGPDEAREDIHQGPWSPYNGRVRDDERDTWGARGRDYWIEDDRWEDRRMGMGDQWRHPEDDQPQEDNDQLWGNRMGLREEPSERSVPRAGAWQHEPRYGEMERMWSDRDDHPWPNERRAADEERREHRDYAHSRYSSRERNDDYARERGGEQYPRHAHQDWRDDSNRGWRDEEPRYWTDRSERDRGERDRGEPQRSRQNQRLLEGREQQRLLDEERFGGAEPSWVERTYQRGYDGGGGHGGGAYGGGDARYTRDDHGRVMGRDMRGRDDRDRDMQRRDMRGRDDRDTRGRDDRDRDMQRRDMRGREHHEMRGGDMRGREHHEMRGGDMHGREDRDRDMQRRDMQRRDDRDMQHRDDRHPGQHRDDQHRDDQGRGGHHGDDRSVGHFGGQRRDRNRYD